MKNLDETTIRVIPHLTIRGNARCVFVEFSYTTLTMTRTSVVIHVVSEFTDTPGGCSYTSSGYQVTLSTWSGKEATPHLPFSPHPLPVSSQVIVGEAAEGPAGAGPEEAGVRRPAASPPEPAGP